MYSFEHARAPVPASFMSAFVRRKQYIGQIELLGELVAYTTFGRRLAGRRVFHFVDNTSALAASARGYAGAPDSRRLVHALHALLSGLRISAWFDYVRSEANISDAPSRDPSLDWREMRLEAGVVSYPTELFLPEPRAWAAEAADWSSAADGLP